MVGLLNYIEHGVGFSNCFTIIRKYQRNQEGEDNFTNMFFNSNISRNGSLKQGGN